MTADGGDRHTADGVLFGRIAVRGGCLTQAQLDEALAIQERSKPTPSLGGVLVDLGYLTPQALAQVLERQRVALARPHPSADENLIDSLFGKLAVRLGYTSPERVNECIRLQAVVGRFSVRTPPFFRGGPPWGARKRDRRR